jgi:hypothetical protein
VEKKLFLSGSDCIAFVVTKLAEEVPLLRNFMETPGVSSGCVDKSRKFGADQLILMKPITFLPPLKSPVKGESEKKMQVVDWQVIFYAVMWEGEKSWGCK